MSDTCTELEQLLYREIPLCRALQVRVEDWADHELRLALPLAANGNPHGTQFGGSLYCAALLAGWGWLHLRLVEEGLAGAVVIREAQIDYLSPLAGDARARCAAPPAEEWERFVALFRRRGLARLTLHSEVLDEAGGIAVRFCGQFVLQREAQA